MTVCLGEFVLKLKSSTVTAWLVMIMDFFHYIAFMCTKPYIKNILDEINVGDGPAGIILALFSFIQVASALALGVWIQKKGQKPQLVLGSVLYLVSGLMLAYVHELGALFGSYSSIAMVSIVTVGVLMFGLSHGVFLIAGHYVITGIPKEEGRDKYVSLLTAINSIGQFVGPLLASVILETWITKQNGVGEFKSVMIISAIASGIALVLACIIKNVTNGVTKKAQDVRVVLRDKPLMKIVFLNAAVYFSTDIVTSYTVKFCTDGLLFSTSLATMVVSAYKLSQIFVRAVLGWLIKFVGSARLLKLSLLFVALTLAGMGLTKEISQLLAMLGLPFMATKIVVVMLFSLLFGIANGLVNPLALIELSNKSNDVNRGPALALRNMCNGGGQTIGEVAFGFIAAMTGGLFSPVFLISSAVLFGCFMIPFDDKKGAEATPPTDK